MKQAKSQKQAAGKTYNKKRKAESVNKPDTDSDAKIAESLPKGKQSKRVKLEQNPVAVVKQPQKKKRRGKETFCLFKSQILMLILQRCCRRANNQNELKLNNTP